MRLLKYLYTSGTLDFPCTINKHSVSVIVISVTTQCPQVSVTNNLSNDIVSADTLLETFLLRRSFPKFTLRLFLLS